VRTLVPLAIAALLTACVADPPPAEEVRRQALPNVGFDRGAWAAGAASGEAVQQDWLRTFNDPQLDALVQEALAHNPDMRITAARVEQAAQSLIIAQSALRPWFGIFGTGGGKSGGGGGGDSSSALQALMLFASWELDVWGRIRYGRNAAQQDLASAQADFAFARQSLAASVAKAWFSATQLTLNAAIAGDMVRSANQLTSLAQDRERVGAGTDAETAVARGRAKELEASQQQIDLARTQALRALELLVGRYPAAEVQARAELLALPGPITAGIPLQMLERRPDVIAAERRVAAAFNRIGEAKAARLPQLTLSANFGAFESEVLELQEDFDNPVGGLGGRLLAPLYQGGSLNAQVEIRTLQQREALADYARVSLRALGDVENALATSASLASRAALLTDALNEQARALELTETQFKIGRADRRAVEQQRLNMQNARIAWHNVRTDELAGRVNLHLALGGSFAPVSP
jgi:outer membrane protein, multidrug efflux system